MRLSSLLRHAWRLLCRNRLIWLLSILSVSVTQLILYLPTRSPSALVVISLSCLTFWLNLLPIFLEGGMIYAAFQQSNEQPFSLVETWRFVWARFLRLLGTILLVGLVAVVIGLVLAALIAFGYGGVHAITVMPLSYVNSLYALLIILVAAVFLASPIYVFGLRTALLEASPILEAFTHGTRIYFQNFRLVWTSFLLYFVFTDFIEYFVAILYLALLEPSTFSSLMAGPWLQQINFLSSTTPARIYYIINSLVSLPFLSIFMTLIYKQTVEKELSANPPEPSGEPSYTNYLRHYRRRTSQRVPIRRKVERSQ